MGISPDKTTWHSERIDVPARSQFNLREVAPTIWDILCDLLCEQRIQNWCDTWDVNFIVNLCSQEGDGKIVNGKDLDGWHVDGDFFAHLLDSSEQALLMIPLFIDTRPNSGGTMLYPNALSDIVTFLHDHPEGMKFSGASF